MKVGESLSADKMGIKQIPKSKFVAWLESIGLVYGKN